MGQGAVCAFTLPKDVRSRRKVRNAAKAGDLRQLAQVLQQEQPGAQQCHSGTNLNPEDRGPYCAHAIGGSERFSVAVHPRDGKGYGGRLLEHAEGDTRWMLQLSVLRALMRLPSSIIAGEELVAGRTNPLLGIYANSVLRCVSLFARRSSGAADEPPQPDKEHRVYVQAAHDAHELVFQHGYQLCAQVQAKSMPWGSVEVLIHEAQLRPVRAEVVNSLQLALLASSAWILALPALLDWRVLVVPSHSMEPTIAKGDVVAVKTVHNAQREIKRTDIVAFLPPQQLLDIASANGDQLSENQLFIKRVLGVENDIMGASDGKLRRNGHYIAPPSQQLCSVCAEAHYHWEDETVGHDEVAVLGDNRGASTDSHRWGMLPLKKIVGKVAFRVAPFERFGRL